MNNKNWIAVFFGLAALVLFVGVFATSNNFMGNNNGAQNNGTTPQQINQTIRNMDNNKAPDGTLPTEINGNEMMDKMQNTMTNPNNTTNQNNTIPNTNNDQNNTNPNKQDDNILNMINPAR